MPRRWRRRRPAEKNIKIYNRLARTQIAREAAGEIKYKDHRLLALYFDMTTMPPVDQMRALEAAQKFIRTQMTDGGPGVRSCATREARWMCCRTSAPTATGC